jgi:hypothetical protein
MHSFFILAGTVRALYLECWHERVSYKRVMILSNMNNQSPLDVHQNRLNYLSVLGRNL